jgi:hypothetical protein
VLSCPQRRYEYDLEHRRMQPADHRVHRDSQHSSATVLTTYDHRGRLRAYA